MKCIKVSSADTESTSTASQTDAYEVTYDWDSDESLCYRVVEGVAAVTGERTTAIEPLRDVIDPEALNRLFRSTAGEDATVSFTFHQCDVTVRSDGHIRIEAAT